MTEKEFRSFTNEKIVILDGATGSNLQSRGMPVGVCPEQWILENKEIVIKLQEEFLEAGTDIILAPTFTGNRIKLGEYGLQDQIATINQDLVGISKAAIASYREKTGSNRPIYIAADISMTGEQVYPVGKMPFEKLVEIYKEQMGYILEAGVDMFIVETMMSLQESRAALLAAKECSNLPVMITLTYNENGRTFYGTNPKTAITVLQSMGADAVGLNCSTGPDKMHHLIREMKEYAHIPVIAKPNAGLPKLVNGETYFPMSPEEFALEMEQLILEGASIVGGCCGTTPEHIKQMVNRIEHMAPPVVREEHVRAITTERNTLDIPLAGRFLIVGERINPTGKKVLQEQLRQKDYSLVGQMATEQAELGADILDINVGMNGIDEKETMVSVVDEVMRMTELPLCIDTSKIEIMETVLRLYPGRALMNSISLEKEKVDVLLPIARKYGAMFILLPLSDKGMPKDIEEKKIIIQTILEKAYALGLRKEDIVVDGLVNTVGANPKAAIEAMETIRYCKEDLGIATIAGLSNISFGLPERQYVNSTFLAFAIQAGLTMAIANPSQDLLMNTALASDLLLGKQDSANRYIDRITTVVAEPNPSPSQNTGFIQRLPSSPKKGSSLENVSPLVSSRETSSKGAFSKEMRFEEENQQAIFQSVLKGNRAGIVALVEKELKNGTQPEFIVEHILISAINEVGSLFDRQIYFLPQLISGAEAMKLAIEYLEPKLTRDESSSSKGTIIMATVAGDIHDIGKNLVVLMLKNYGFRVIDLGKDVPTDKILQVAKEENADIIGLSALMTTTMVEMKKVVTKAREQGIKARIIIGGAVITDSYCEEIGADGYSPDAQAAVGLVKRLLDRK